MQYGHFDNEHREYVIDKVDLPMSWTNYLGTENMVGVVNHTAGGYLFYKSAEYHRITCCSTSTAWTQIKSSRTARLFP